MDLFYQTQSVATISFITQAITIFS